jgi:hypothetical protein
MIKEAIDHYHSLLHGDHLAGLGETLDRAASERNLTFRGRPLCQVLRPYFMTGRRYDLARRQTEMVLQAIARVGAALAEDGIVREFLQLSRVERELLQIDPGYAGPEASGRLDGLLDAGGELRFIEYNADSPGGLLYGDLLGEIFMESTIMREFAERYRVRTIDVRKRLVRTLLECYREWLGTTGRELPRVAIVDWEGVATREEFEICRRHLQQLGIPTIITTPEELRYRGGWLWAGDFRITLVYKRVVIAELIERYGDKEILKHPLLRAVRERAVCVVNGFRAQAITQKLIFAILDDPVFESLFSREEIAILRRHIPWTRLHHQGITTWQGRRIDLPEFALANRDRLLLKPTGSYGGRGVTLGWECTDAEWHQALKETLGGRFVIQERVVSPPQPFPIRDGEGVRIEMRYGDFSPYTWQSDLAEGAGIRLSDSTLLNVSAGGGSAVPLVLVD